MQAYHKTKVRFGRSFASVSSLACGLAVKKGGGLGGLARRRGGERETSRKPPPYRPTCDVCSLSLHHSALPAANPPWTASRYCYQPTTTTNTPHTSHLAHNEQASSTNKQPPPRRVSVANGFCLITSPRLLPHFFVACQTPDRVAETTCIRS